MRRGTGKPKSVQFDETAMVGHVFPSRIFMNGCFERKMGKIWLVLPEKTEGWMCPAEKGGSGNQKTCTKR